MSKREIRPGISRLFRLAGRTDAARDADDEIALHLQLRIDELIASGMSPESARAEAERLFGAVEEERARFADSVRRREGRVQLREWLESVGQDVRYAFRTLRRDAGFTLFAVLIVGLGIGASATVFSVVNAMLLRPLPFRDPAQLVWIANELSRRGYCLAAGDIVATGTWTGLHFVREPAEVVADFGSLGRVEVSVRA